MAINLTPTNQSLSKQTSINPQLVLQIEGIETVFGAQPVLEFARWDTENLRWDDGLTRWDGLTQKPESLAVIDLSNGTTDNITQQILPDKGGSSSISTVNIQMVDLDNKVARILSFENITEILGKKADVFIGFKQAAFPDNGIPIFRGVIVDFYTQDGVVMVSVAHPEALKRQVIYQSFQSNLSGAINNSVTSIDVEDTTGLIESQDISTTFIRIDDEIMEVTSINSQTNLTVVRGSEGTIAVSHNDDSEVTSIYKLQENPIDLALKLMLSNEGNEYFFSDDIPKSVNFISVTEPLPNSLIFDYFDIEDLTGLVPGDSIRLTGTNAGTYTIQALGTLDDGSFITVEETLIDEIEFAGTFEYKSQYNVLPQGLEMLPNQVDIQGHLDIQNQFPSNFVDYTFYLNETLEDIQDFLSKEIYFPQGLYTIPRKARASVKLVTPPFSSEIVPTINTQNMINATQIKQRRSLHKYLYNIIRYDYNRDILEDRFTSKDVIISSDSLNRIKGGRKELKIESLGLRRGSSTTVALNQITQRVIDRYRFAPTYFQDIQIKYSDGFNLEVGDILPFGGSDTKLVDLQTGIRGAKERLFEVINKKLNIKTGDITVDLLETAFDIDARNAVVSLASGIGANSTTTRIEINRLVDTGEYINESDKWQEFAGQQVRIYSPDYTFDELATLQAVDSGNVNFLILDSPLSVAPSEGYIIGIPEYDNTDEDINDVYKLRFCHYVAQSKITSVTDAQTFEVDDASKLLEGSRIVVNSPDYVRDSFGTEVIIDSINANEITLTEALSFTPLVDDLVNRSNFLDGGAYYSVI